MPRGLKETSSIITIGASVEESAANTFTSARVDLQLNPLDNEVFIVYAIDMDLEAPDLVGGAVTLSQASLSTTQRSSIGGIDDSNVLAASRIETQEVGGAAVTNEYKSDSSPATTLDYLAIISTNDFFLNVLGSPANPSTMNLNARVYGARARADSSVYAALVQSELLSA